MSLFSTMRELKAILADFMRAISSSQICSLQKTTSLKFILLLKHLSNSVCLHLQLKTVFFDKLPDDILELTEKNEVPVFLFNNIYIEDVILSITDHLRSSSNYNYYENLIDSFLTSPSKQSNIKEFVNSLSPDSDSLKSENLVTTLYLMSENETDEFTLQRNINKLTLRAKHLSIAVSIKILKYKKGILLMCFGNETTNYENIRKTVISELSLSSYTIGFSDFALPLNKIDISIERSINSCIFALKNQKKLSNTAI